MFDSLLKKETIQKFQCDVPSLLKRILYWDFQKLRNPACHEEVGQTDEKKIYKFYASITIKTEQILCNSLI